MFRKRYSLPGSAPATLTAPPGASAKPVLRVTEYDANSATERIVERIEDLPLPGNDGRVLWLEMNGLGDVEMLRALGQRYNLHPLALEDVVNLGQRPKLETHHVRHLFAIAQMIYRDTEECLCAEQVSIFFCKNLLISIQEDPGEDVFGPVRQRIHAGGGYLRSLGADYLAYALLDAIVDHCFPVLEQLGDAIEEMEEEILSHPQKTTVAQLHHYKRTLMQLRRFVWPERDVVSALLHSDSPHVSPEVKVFLRDLYDHTVQIIDLIEAYRELTTSLFEMYLSSVSLRTGEVMRLLTVISSIFIPLTFIAGVYGMNFDYMPGREHPWGYFACLGVMLLIAIGQVIFFRRKGWI